MADQKKAAPKPKAYIVERPYDQTTHAYKTPGEAAKFLVGKLEELQALSKYDSGLKARIAEGREYIGDVATFFNANPGHHEYPVDLVLDESLNIRFQATIRRLPELLKVGA